jgi:cofilin
MVLEENALTDTQLHRRPQGTFTASRFLNGPRPCPPSTLTPPEKTSPTATDTLSPSSVSVTPECIQAFNELKLGKSLKWIIFKISDDWKEIVVEETSTESNYDAFREKLINAKSKDRKGVEGIGGRYAVYDVEYDAPGGEGKRSKITFISWVPDDATQYVSIKSEENRGMCV